MEKYRHFECKIYPLEHFGIGRLKLWLWQTLPRSIPDFLEWTMRCFQVFFLKHNPSKHKHHWSTEGARAEWLWCSDQVRQRSSHCPQAWRKQIIELLSSLLQKQRPNLTRAWKLNSYSATQSACVTREWHHHCSLQRTGPLTKNRSSSLKWKGNSES